jgi:hypothetical protein
VAPSSHQMLVPLICVAHELCSNPSHHRVIKFTFRFMTPPSLLLLPERCGGSQRTGIANIKSTGKVCSSPIGEKDIFCQRLYTSSLTPSSLLLLREICVSSRWTGTANMEKTAKVGSSQTLEKDIFRQRLYTRSLNPSSMLLLREICVSPRGHILPT